MQQSTVDMQKKKKSATSTKSARTKNSNKKSSASKTNNSKVDTEMKASERRIDERAPCKVKVDCRDVDVFVSSKIMNISRGGLYVKTLKPPPMNTPLEIEFTLPAGQEPVHATGLVVWINPSASRGNAMLPVGVGIHFNEITRKDLKKIEEYIEWAKKQDRF